MARTRSEMRLVLISISLISLAMVRIEAMRMSASHSTSSPTWAARLSSLGIIHARVGEGRRDLPGVRHAGALRARW